MKKLPSVRVIVMTIIAIVLFNIIFSFDYKVKQEKGNNSSDTVTVAYIERKYSANSITTLEIDGGIPEVETSNAVIDVVKEPVDYSEVYPEIIPIVYDGMTLEQLGEKLDRSLKSTLSGKGYTIASYALEYDVDPYLAVAIMLHETGCASGKCSGLTSRCFNVGGMKGGPTCGNGSYRKFNSLDEGIESFMKNLSKNYIKKGLTTPEAINTKYAASTTWSDRIKYYINKIENN